MPKYRKKPIIIDAIRFDGTLESASQVYDLIGDKVGFYDSLAQGVGSINIATLDGSVAVPPGNYIIKEMSGEVYHREPDSFEATHEPADI